MNLMNNELANLLPAKAWTVSDQNKHPLNPQNIKYNWNANTRLTDYHTAKELADAYDYHVAYRIDSYRDHCLFFDLEAQHGDIEENIFTLLPLAYCERSTSGGYHGILKLPDNIITNYEKLLKCHTTFKCSTTPEQHSGLEIFTKKHFLTFTENVIKPPTAKSDDFDTLFTVMKNMTTNNTFKTDIVPIDINDPVLKTAYLNALAFLQNRPNADDTYLDRILTKIDEIYNTDFDRSHADYRMLWTIYGYLKIYLYNSTNGLAYQNDMYNRADIRAGLLMNLATSLANKYQRDKWFNHMIHKVNYLTYTSEQIIARDDAQALELI